MKRYLGIYGYSLKLGKFLVIKRAYDKKSYQRNSPNNCYDLVTDMAYPYELTPNGLYPNHHFVDDVTRQPQSFALSRQDIHLLADDKYLHLPNLYVINLNQNNNYQLNMLYQVAQMLTEHKISKNFKASHNHLQNLKKTHQINYIRQEGR